MTPDVEQLRAVLDRLVAIRVGPDGSQLEEDEVEIMVALGKLQFLASDLRESRLVAWKKLRAAERAGMRL